MVGGEPAAEAAAAAGKCRCSASILWKSSRSRRRPERLLRFGVDEGAARLCDGGDRVAVAVVVVVVVSAAADFGAPATAEAAGMRIVALPVASWLAMPAGSSGGGGGVPGAAPVLSCTWGRNRGEVIVAAAAVVEAAAAESGTSGSDGPAATGGRAAATKAAA